MQSIYTSLTEKKHNGKKQFAVLIDPDKVNAGSVSRLVKIAVEAGVDYFFVGGSLVISNFMDTCVQMIKGV